MLGWHLLGGGLGEEVMEAPGILDALAPGLAGGSGQSSRVLGEGF